MKEQFSFQTFYKKELDQIDRHLEKSLLFLVKKDELSRRKKARASREKPSGFAPISKAIKKLYESMNYSLFPGGKRFRPLLAVLLAKSLKKPVRLVLPYSSALEMIHIYSLIHDDLPCMDNAMTRRGKKANHRVFGEAFALLSGNVLLTEALLLLVRSYSKEEPSLGLKLIEEVLEAIGFSGMMGGQAMDIQRQMGDQRGWIKRETSRSSEKTDKEKEILEIKDLQRRKTGFFIESALVGAAHILKVHPSLKKRIRKFGFYLGMAFQVADDLCDHLRVGKIKEQDVQAQREARVSFCGSMGLKMSKNFLSELTKTALSCIPEKEFHFLRKLAEFNRDRGF